MLVVDVYGGMDVSGTFGDILVARLKVRGVAGIVSDGPMRDIAELRKMDFPVFTRGNAAPPSYASISVRRAVLDRHPVHEQAVDGPVVRNEFRALGPRELAEGISSASTGMPGLSRASASRSRCCSNWQAGDQDCRDQGGMHSL